jgi:hypothetical protein
MNGEIITIIVGVIMGGLGTLITRYIIPWLKARTSAEDWQLTVSMVEAAVRAAYSEGVKKEWTGESQKAWAIAHAKDEFGIDLTEPQLDIIRKSVVQQVKRIGDAAQGK